MSRRNDAAHIVGIVLVVVGFVALCTGAMWFEYRYPCLRYESYWTTRRDCHTYGSDKSTHTECETRPVRQRRCVEWTVRP